MSNLEFKEFIDIAKVRQSCRNFDPERIVDEEVLDSLVDAMILSPSACNAQPYFYHIVTGDKAKKVRDTLTGMGMNSFVKNVNAFAVVTEENYNLTAKIGSSMKNQDFKSIDIGISVAYFTAEATTLGLGTCIMGWFDEDELKKIVDTKSRIRLVIAIGYPSDDDFIREKKRKTHTAISKFIK